MRRLKTKVAAAVSAAALTLAGLAAISPAQAAPGDTTVTFNITAAAGGGLSISVPASASLGSGHPGDVVSGALGTVTVSDTRAALVATWTATVSSSNFTTGGGTAGETIAKSNVSYFSGLTTTVSGLNLTIGTLQLGALNAIALPAPATAVAVSVGVGSNVVSWNPTVLVTVPGTAVAGTYTGTVTHSVA